jgi:ABC-2 type transport system permease protein
LELIIFFIFVALDKLPFTAKFVFLLYPIGCLILFNLGVGLILSALYIFFRDMTYLYGIFTQVLMFFSAIFYEVDRFPEHLQKIFLFNPIYIYIKYFRSIVIDSQIPSLGLHLAGLGYAIVFLFLGMFMYKKYNYKFLYYI